MTPSAGFPSAVVILPLICPIVAVESLARAITELNMSKISTVSFLSRVIFCISGAKVVCYKVEEVSNSVIPFTENGKDVSLHLFTYTFDEFAAILRSRSLAL